MLTETQDQLLVGSILGDSHVERNGSNCRVRFDHCMEQREYVYWKQDMLFPLALRVAECQARDKRNGRIYKKARFNTKTLACFN